MTTVKSPCNLSQCGHMTSHFMTALTYDANQGPVVIVSQGLPVQILY